MAPENKAASIAPMALPLSGSTDKKRSASARTTYQIPSSADPCCFQTFQNSAHLDNAPGVLTSPSDRVEHFNALRQCALLPPFLRAYVQMLQAIGGPSIAS